MMQSHPQDAAPARPQATICCLALMLFFLAGPVLIAVELLKPVFSIPLVFLLLVWLWRFVFFLSPDFASLWRQPLITPAWRDALGPAATALLIAAAWIYFSGIGSFTYCRFDYLKHNLIFTSLLDSSLPIRTGPGDGDIIHYYFAYYILPVRLYEGLHPFIARLRLDHVIYVVYVAALLASLRLLASSLRVSAIGLLVIMVFAGGVDLLGRLLLGPALAPYGQAASIAIPIYVDLDWWGVPLAPQSLTLNLFWAPQHFFGALIGTALISSFVSLPRPRIEQMLHGACVVAASAFWSPYVAVGLAVVMLGVWLKFLFAGQFVSAAPGAGGAAIAMGRAGTVAFLVLLLAFVAVFFAAASPTSPPALIFFHAAFGKWLVSFLVRLAPVIAALAGVMIWRFRRRETNLAGEEASEMTALARTLGFLLAADAALLCLTHGNYDDWAMRTTLPISILVGVGLLRFLGSAAGASSKAIVIALLVVSSASSLNEIDQSAFLPRSCSPYGSFVWQDLGGLAQQYRGRSDSLLYRWLVRNHGL